MRGTGGKYIAIEDIVHGHPETIWHTQTQVPGPLGKSGGAGGSVLGGCCIHNRFFGDEIVFAPISLKYRILVNQID
jgi:hypothetical protein